MGQKKKVERQGVAAAIDRLDEMIPLITRDVEVALQTEAALESANEIVTGDLSGAQFYGADCYNAVKLSMSLFLALTLAKLFETPSLRRGKSKSERLNKSDVASIPLMIRLLKQARCRKRLCSRAHNWKPTNVPEIHAKSCERAIDRAIDAYDQFRRTHAGRNAVAKLKRFRDKKIAHTLLDIALTSTPTKGRPSKSAPPLYRELFVLMDVARNVAEHARLAIAGIHIDLRESEEEHVNVARAFWRPALTAAARTGDGPGQTEAGA
jgi:hypothetical protein